MRNSIPDNLRNKVQEAFNNCCAYCQSSQQYVLGILEIDHIIPISAGGTNNKENLCLACRLCNGYKSNQTIAIDPELEIETTLFNPRVQNWNDHFEWSDSATHIIGKTSCGRATINALNLNNTIAITVRANWVKAGWHPPEIHSD